MSHTFVTIAVNVTGMDIETIYATGAAYLTHLDRYYRKLGGSGLELADGKTENARETSFYKTLCADDGLMVLSLVPKDDSDDHIFAELTNTYIQSPEFIEWAKGLM